mmetsp:Transcript_91115/g.174741  ORF Transcript_91115/g.174741 Transcript_91115/m.174741 type:complete len:554 (+) Transcript_91115:112-1773(+)
MSWGPKPGEIRNGLGVDRSITHEVVPTGSQGGGLRHMDKQNVGYSGTPLWKLALDRQHREQEAAASSPTVKIPEGFRPVDKATAAHFPVAGRWYYSEKRKLFFNAADAKLYVWDSVAQKHTQLHEAHMSEMRLAVGSCFHEKAVQVKHVIVNDLAKAAQALRMPIDHLDRPCAFYGLYEGHHSATSSTASAANVCADFCSKQVHQKLLPKLAAFRGYWEDDRLRAVMRECFEELDVEFAEKHSTSSDGCCAAVALITGRRLVIASVGDVASVVCMRNGEATEQVRAHTFRNPDGDDDEDEEDNAEDSAAAEALTTDPVIRWTRAIGDLQFKKPDSAPRLLATPDVAVLHLEHRHQGFAFICRALYNAIGRNVAVSTVFRRSTGRPRMASGALLDAAVQWLGQVGDLGLGSIVVFFDHIEGSDLPPQKRARTEQTSQVRLRHILLKHRECKSTVDKVRNKQVKRSRAEAERILRAALEECEGDPKRATFAQRCRELSECVSCLRAGDLAGDLGWVKPTKKYGQAFDDAAFLLQIGQLSDLVDSDQGIHIILRTA